MNSQKNCGIYIRVSSQEQNPGMQRADLEAFAKARGWTVYKLYEEKQTGRHDRRSEFQACLNDARKRKFDIFLVWKLDRAFRSLKDCVIHIQTLAEVGVDFLSYKENLDLSTSQGRLMLHIVAAFAEFEAEMIRMRVRSGLDHARAEGVRLGRPPRADHAKIAELRAQGMSLSKIALSVGITKSGVSKSLSKSAVNNPVRKSESIEIASARGRGGKK